MMGLYKPNGKDSDKAVLLELYNGRSEYYRTMKSSAIVIKEPRLNITMAGHPDVWMNMLNELNESGFSDGFLHRFLFHAPKSPPVKMINQQEKTGICSISCLLYTIAKMNQKKTDYMLDEEALAIFNEKNEEYCMYAEKYGYDNPYIR